MIKDWLVRLSSCWRYVVAVSSSLCLAPLRKSNCAPRRRKGHEDVCFSSRRSGSFLCSNHSEQIEDLSDKSYVFVVIITRCHRFSGKKSLTRNASSVIVPPTAYLQRVFNPDVSSSHPPPPPWGPSPLRPHPLLLLLLTAQRAGTRSGSCPWWKSCWWSCRSMTPYPRGQEVSSL